MKIPHHCLLALLLPLLVLNSHSHYDHIGGNYQFSNLMGRDTAFGRARARGIPNHKLAEFVSPAWIRKTPPSGFDPNTYSIKPYSVSLIDHNNRVLFTGDAFYPAPLYAHLEGSELRDYRASAAKMAALSERVDTLVTSHNVPTASSDYLPAMERAFEAIVTGNADYTLSDGAREYKFAGFSVLTSDPP